MKYNKVQVLLDTLFLILIVCHQMWYREGRWKMQQNSELQQDPNEFHENGDKSPKKGNNEVLEWLKAIVIAVILVILIRWLLFKPFIVDGPSMKPNFHTGERLIVNEILYDIRQPKKSEVIVFHVPSEGRDFIKRVIAVAGDTVKVEGDTVYVNGEPINEPYIQAEIDSRHEQNLTYNNKDFPNANFPDGTVPEGHIFVMGDNRSDSTDSRMIGYVPLGDIVGRADVIFWPVKDIEWINH